jgi:hypothetical protein
MIQRIYRLLAMIRSLAAHYTQIIASKTHPIANLMRGWSLLPGVKPIIVSGEKIKSNKVFGRDDRCVRGVDADKP